VSNSNGNREGDCNGNEDSMQQRGQWQWWQEMAMATRGACNKERYGNGGKNNGNGNKGGRQATATQAMARAMLMTCVMATAKRLAGNKEGKSKDGMGDGNGNEGGRQQRG
jgi:hypothetical protein